jgi:tetratricopeptide (TPR) repeat protein
MRLPAPFQLLAFLALLLQAAAVDAGQSAPAARTTPTTSTRDASAAGTAAGVTAFSDGRTRWALIVGVSKYKDLPPSAQLQYPDNDAEEIARFLRSPQGGSLDAMHMRVLTNEYATVAAIRGALNTWLPRVVGPNDIVYLFIAGHGVLAEENAGYFVAHDSDPQNLHATGLAFDEVNQVLNDRIHADLIVLMADACHAGGVGWASDPATPSRAQDAIAAIGRDDRSFLKLLASRPSEQSFEDRRWDGGHGVFTYALLRGLRGDADRERDGVVRAGELIDFVSKVVPEQTQAAQNPRVAGNFEPRLVLALSSLPPEATGASAANLSVHGPAGASVYVDDRFRGAIRPSGELSVAALSAGVHRVSVDVPQEGSFEQQITLLGATDATLDILQSPAWSLARLEGLVRRGLIMEKGGALDLYRATTWPVQQQPMADALLSTGLENTGQECIGDYVQSTAGGLKGAMLLRSVEAFAQLRKLRPMDASVEMKEKFCLARAQIADSDFSAAVDNLQAVLRIDAGFACAYNALGVAYARLGRARESRSAFDKAAELTPEWGLPYLQIAQTLVNAGKTRDAIPYLEKAVKFNPRAIQSQWSLLHAYRIADRDADFDRQAREVLALDANYAPTYLDIGSYFESHQNLASAARAYDIYLSLAPNFADSAQIRTRSARLREQADRRRQ